MSLGQSIYDVYKNPQCNWECCLSVILSAQDTSPSLQDGAGDGDNSVKDSIMLLLKTKVKSLKMNNQIVCKLEGNGDE